MNVETETITPEEAARKRASDALAIQEGACNPLGITNSLLRHMQALSRQPDSKGTSEILADPACRLIVHQLAFLFNVDEINDGLLTYSALTKACEEAKAA
jgi:hypothetical protein